MNRIRPMRSALVVLSVMAAWSQWCSAAVMVLSNRTSEKVGFVLVENEEEHNYTLAPGELRALRIGPATGFWFADDADNGYRLRSDCAYVILRSTRQGRRELHRVGLAEEQDGLGEAAPTEPEPSATTADAHCRARVEIILACDGSASNKGEGWESRLRATVKKASQITERQCGVAFDTVDFQIWTPDRPLADFEESWRELIAAVPAQPGKIVVGFTTRLEPVVNCSSLPAEPLASHLLICEGRAPRPDQERLEALLHALGHYLGGAHSPEPDSVMRPALDRRTNASRSALHFDPINALAMALVGDELATAAPQNFSQLSPRVRGRLGSVYATLSEALPADPLAERWSRLLETAPVEAPSSIAEVEKPSPQPGMLAPARDGADQSDTGPPIEHHSRPTIDRAAGQLEGDETHAFDDERAEPVGSRDFRGDRSGLPQALLLALALVAIPAGVIIWQVSSRDAAVDVAQIQGDDGGPTRLQPLQLVDRAAWAAYLASVTIVAGLVATSTFYSDLGGCKAAALLLLTGMAVMMIAPLYPIAGPLVYLVLSYALQREDPAAVRIENSGVMAYLPVMALAALGVRLLRQRRRPRPPRGPLTWALLAMMAWIGLSVAGAAIGGLPVTPQLVHRAARLAQILVLFLITTQAEVGLAELRLTSLVLGLTLFVRVHVFKADVSMEQNLAMLAAIVCPLLFVAAQTAPARLAMLGYTLMLAYFVCLIVYGQNRAAMLSVPLCAAVLLLSSRHRRLALLIAAPVVVALTVLLPASGLVDRFGEIYQAGEFQGSAYFRLRIWAAGWQMAREHAGFGVGPGNFELFDQGYDPQLPPIGPHNSLVQMAAETGFVGAALYVGLLLAAAWQLISTIRRLRDDWRGAAAGGVLAMLAAYVVTGCFLENPSLAVMYVLLAMSIGLSAAPVTRVYRERLHLPLPSVLAKPLAELAVRWPRVVSGMPVGWRPALPRRPPTAAGSAEPRQDPKRWLRVGLAVYAAATIAGSLAPFSFQPMSVPAAVDHYWRQMSRSVEFSDRADWLANVLLFVPLGFLAMTTCYRRRQAAHRLAAGVLILLGCFLFSSLIELAQIWFPSRTVNPNDVAAESMGAAAGIVLFLLFGDRFVQRASGVLATRNPLRASEKLLLCYAAGVLIYAAWPFDMTINPTDFAAKLREGRIHFTDWSQPDWFATFAASAALMAPIGILLRTLGTPRNEPLRRLPAVIGLGFVWLLAIEFCRLLAFSQTVSLMHFAGGAAGILLGALAARLFPAPTPTRSVGEE